MPKLPIAPLDLLVINAGAFNTLMGFAQSTNPMSDELKSKLMEEVNIGIPQAVFTELDFLRHLEVWEEEDEDSLSWRIAEYWKALSPEDQEAQLRYWIDEDYDWACSQVNDALVARIENDISDDLQ